MNWETIKNLWNSVKSLVIPSAAKIGGKFYTKLGDLVASKCKDGKADKVKPLVHDFMLTNTQLLDHAMDGDYTDEERSADAVNAAALIQAIMDV